MSLRPSILLSTLSSNTLDPYKR